MINKISEITLRHEENSIHVLLAAVKVIKELDNFVESNGKQSIEKVRGTYVHGYGLLVLPSNKGQDQVNSHNWLLK